MIEVSFDKKKGKHKISIGCEEVSAATYYEGELEDWAECVEFAIAYISGVRYCDEYGLRLLGFECNKARDFQASFYNPETDESEHSSDSVPENCFISVFNNMPNDEQKEFIELCSNKLKD